MIKCFTERDITDVNDLLLLIANRTRETFSFNVDYLNRRNSQKHRWQDRDYL